MGHRVEKAKSGRSSCTTCSAMIEKGDVRVAEEVNDISIGRLIHRFYHLRCAVATHPLLVRRALDTFVEDGVIFDREDVEAKIAPHVQLDREQRLARYEAQLEAKPVRPATPPPDDTTRELLDALAADPDDVETLAVLADQLQGRGDPRGELIALELARSANPRDSAIAQRRADLMHELAPPLDAGDRATWGKGFIRRLELGPRSGTRLAETVAMWAHPSLALLSELRVQFKTSHDTNFIARLVELAPRGLRTLELVSPGNPLPEVPSLITTLPRLVALHLIGRIPLDTIAHPTLRRLELGVAEPFATVAGLRPHQLPAVTELAFHAAYPSRDFDELFDPLAAWFDRLTSLSLLRGELSASGIATLERLLAGRKLARLDLSGTPMRLALRSRLAALCTDLVMPDLVAETTEHFVEHTAKPEWGRGRLVRRYDGKVEIEFPAAGRKVFKADAPFLRFG